MSTLGDLLAEHTMLPGNAVDHLHAVVGEWQLLADLSFADYLMWVRRDDERAGVCGAMPAEYRADRHADRRGGQRRHRRTGAARRRGFRCRRRRRPGAGKRCGPTGFVATARPARRRVAGAIRRAGGGGAHAAPDRTGGRAQLRSPGDRLPGVRDGSSAHARGGHISRRARRGHVALHPARRRRLHPPRCRWCGRLRQPQRAVGLPPDGPDQRAGRSQPGPGHPAR